ncbi:hypothetical protein ACQKWADRAFT_281339 [Trichoderma austrokoningii]
MSPRISRLSAVAALVAVAGAATVKVTATKATTALEPCAQIAKLTAAGTTSFSSQLGLACLESMPFKSDLAVSFVDEFTKYLQWQSDIEILRIDLLGGMSTIRQRAASNLYKSQYDFDQDINNLLNAAHDGHMALIPCSFAIDFSNTDAALVSLSTDGVSLPRLYTLADGKLLANGNKNVSPVTLINGVGAESLVEEGGKAVRFQDPDARYNNLLTNVPNALLGGKTNFGGFAKYSSFPGVHEYNMTFANGTQVTFPLKAGINTPDGNFTVTTGEELFNAVCANPNATDSSSTKSSTKSKREELMAELSKRDATTSKPLAAPTGFPTPIVRDPFNLMVGYFPDDADLKDTAVMTVGSFGTAEIDNQEVITFAEKSQEFVNKAVAAGKSKIIIDLTQNGGGSIVSGFALLSIFFPNMTIFSATRIRSVPETQFIFETANRVTDPEAKSLFDELGFVISSIVEPDQKTVYASTNDFLGPFDALGVPSTAISAGENFRQNNNTENPINIFGKGGVLNGTEAPFKPEDIVILSDGQCSSTCTIFINHMIPYGVRVVANGGRPQLGPMQGIGGVKGSQALVFTTISIYYQLATEAIQDAINAKKPLFTDKEFDAFKDHIPVAIEQFPLKVPTAGVNFRNAFSPFNDEVPTHFIYQPADCRLYYTPASLLKPEANWGIVANAMWNKGECAFSVTPPPPILSDNNKPSSTSASKPASTTAASQKKTQSSARKAVGLLLAMAEGLKPQ